MCRVSRHCDELVWDTLRMVKLSAEDRVPRHDAKVHSDRVLTFVHYEWGMTIWVGHVALCSGAVGKGETVCGLLGVQEVDTGPWGRRLAGDNWKWRKTHRQSNQLIIVSLSDSSGSYDENTSYILDVRSFWLGEEGSDALSVVKL